MAKANKKDLGTLVFKLEQREDVSESATLNVRLEKDLYDDFKNLCESQLKLSISEAIRQIIQQAIAQNGGGRTPEGIGRDSSLGSKNRLNKKS